MDKNKIVMIAPVAVAAILMLGILAATGNAQESSNTSSSQESSETNGATSPTSSQETSKTTTGNAQESSNTSSSQESSQTNGATSPTSSQGASNGKKPTELTLSATPSGSAKTTENNETNETHTEVPVKFSGRLTSDGSGVAGVTIKICSSEHEECDTGHTDSGGHYSVGTMLSDHGKKHEIEASTDYTQQEDETYNESNATTTIKLP